MIQKKKILHIIQSLGNGGCENMLLRTLPLLDDFEHKIITLKEPGELAQKFISAGITVETVCCSNPLDIPGVLRLRKLIQKENPDSIITYLFHADILGRIVLRNYAPVIPFLRTTYNHPKYLIARLFEWLTASLVAQYLANSEAVKDFYVQHIGITPEKIIVIPNGIDTKYFDSITPDPELRKSLGISPDDFVIICVANLHINKGHRYLLEAFEALHSDHNKALSTIQPFKAKLLLVGDGAERESLRQQIKNYTSEKNILFLGRRTDVPQLLKISDCFVLPTLFEGMSNAIMEAMACSLPVITTDIPENHELIKHEKTGILIPTKDSSSLIKAIDGFVNDGQRRKNIGENAKRRISVNFDTKIVVSKLTQFFIEL